jgi:hypothetical protein
MPTHDDEDLPDLPYCAHCDAPFSPEESGHDTTCCDECATANAERSA